MKNVALYVLLMVIIYVLDEIYIYIYIYIYILCLNGTVCFHASVFAFLYAEEGVRYWGHSINFLELSTEHICIYNRLPVDETWGSKHVEDIKKIENQNIKL